MMMRAPRVLCTLVNVGRAFLGDLPFGAASLGSLRASVGGISFSTAILLLVAATTFLFTRERYALGQFTKFLANLLEGQGESNDFCILLICGHPRTIGDHVLVHLVQLDNDIRRSSDFLHDPLIFKLINEEQELLGRRTTKCSKEVRDEALVGVRRRTGLSMNLLANGLHPSSQLVYVVLVLGPEGNFIQLLLEMTHLDNGLGLGYFKHLPEQDEAAVSDVTSLLVREREIILVGQEGLVRSGGNVVLENMEDQLINDPELNLETAHEPDVIRGGAVQTDDPSIDGLSERSIKLHVVSPVEPLGKTLAMVSGDLGPMREHINARKKVHFHNCPPESEVEFLSKAPSPSIGTVMRGPQRWYLLLS